MRLVVLETVDVAVLLAAVGLRALVEHRRRVGRRADRRAAGGGALRGRFALLAIGLLRRGRLVVGWSTLALCAARLGPRRHERRRRVGEAFARALLRAVAAAAQLTVDG